jgi:hypothetical protein
MEILGETPDTLYGYMTVEDTTACDLQCQVLTEMSTVHFERKTIVIDFDDKNMINYFSSGDNL